MERRSIGETSFAVIDIETTGIDAGADAIVEIACVVVRGGVETRSFGSLVDPGRRIPPRASAIHHLTDADVRGQLPLSAVEPVLAAMCGDAVLVAHNAAFDLGFLPTLAGAPSLCTLRLARHLFPELDGHANQLLRYAFATRTRDVGPSHRAMADARVTASVLDVLLRRYVEITGTDDVDALVRFAASPVHVASLPFGEHKRKPLADVPAGYLRWVIGPKTSFDADVKAAVAAELNRRRVASPLPLASGASD
jgi:exodeoxyribonuclease X